MTTAIRSTYTTLELRIDVRPTESADTIRDLMRDDILTLIDAYADKLGVQTVTDADLPALFRGIDAAAKKLTDQIAR